MRLTEEYRYIDEEFSTDDESNNEVCFSTRKVGAYQPAIVYQNEASYLNINDQQQLSSIIDSTQNTPMSSESYRLSQSSSKRFIICAFGTRGYESTTAAMEFLYDMYGERREFTFFELLKPTSIDVNAHVSELTEEIQENQQQNIQTTYIHFGMASGLNKGINQFIINTSPVQEQLCYDSSLNSDIEGFSHHLHTKASELTQGKAVFVNLPSLQCTSRDDLNRFLALVIQFYCYQ